MVADEILVNKALEGDSAAYGELVSRYQDRIYGLACKMLTAPEDARDAAQEIFIRVYKSLPGFDWRSSFATWLYRIATNVCLDFLRRRSRDQKRNLPLEEGRIKQDSFRDNTPGPEETFLEKEKAKMLRQAVDALPDGYRVVLVLHHYQGLSYRQVAQAVSLTEKTVATRIHRAKKLLREKLYGGEGGALSESNKNANKVSGRRMSIL